MKFIRIGNNVNISWEITRYGEKEDLASKNIQVLLIDKNNHKQEFNYTIVDKNKITGIFYGKDQKCCGVYRLLLIENEDTKEQAVLDYIDCFTISQKLKNTTSIGSDAGVETVELTSTISTDTLGGYATIEYVDGEIKKLDISSYAKIDSVPTKTSQLTNDSDYATNADLSTKADITDANLLGTPTAPTADEGTNTTQIATTEFVRTAIDKRKPTTEDRSSNITLSPNKNVDITCDADLTITLEAPTDMTIVNEYSCTVTTGDSIGTTTLPTNVTWEGDTPVLDKNMIYEMLIRYIKGKYYGISHSWTNDVYNGKYSIVAFSNGTDYQFIKDKDNNLADFKENYPDYEPIGIVVIPASCSAIIYPEGDVRRGKNIIMSLKAMNYTTPDTGGTSEQTMYSLANGQSPMGNYNVVNCYNDKDTQSEGGLSTVKGSAYLPSDGSSFTNLASKVYPSLHYYYYNYEKYIPSPFKLVDGELIPNEEYYTTAYSTENALSDFAGPRATKYWIDLTSYYGTKWKTKGTTISNVTSHDISPAACCCARYGAPDNSSAPKGTSSFLYHDTNNPSYDYSQGVVGVWYMPAIGELGFVIPHYSKYADTMTNINTVYESSAAALNQSMIASSTASYTQNTWVLYPYYGGINRFMKYNITHSSRAFCAV